MQSAFLLIGMDTPELRPRSVLVWMDRKKKVDPRDYHPYALPPKIIDGEIVERTLPVDGPIGRGAFDFDAEPPQNLAAEFVQEQHFSMKNTNVKLLLRYSDVDIILSIQKF